MESGQQVNPPPDEGRRKNELKRENCQSGGLKICKVVGVTFGLLCIVQAALNVSLRLQAAGDIRVLITDRDRLIQEKEQLLQEKEQLNRDNKQLVQEKNQLSQSKDHLEDENNHLKVINGRLTRDKRMLDDNILEQQNQITELQTKINMANTLRCPPGWWMLMSSCYQLSCTANTWEYAKANCEKKGAHLVIFNDQLEEDKMDKALQAFCVVKLWIGLSGQKDVFTWVDGNSLHYSNWNDHQPASWYSWSRSCVYTDQKSSVLEKWFLGTCQERYYWMCEKELHSSSI